MSRSIEIGVVAVLLGLLMGCSSDYSPNTYHSTAVQQANKVENGVIVGFREVKISASGTVGAVSGGAAGGILGAQTGTSGMDAALGGVAGTAVGGLLGTAIEHASGDTTGWEYIVRKPNGEMISVTQSEKQPLPLGQKVLVIAGNQARIVPDYSIPLPEADKPKETAQPADASAKEAPKPAPAAAADKPKDAQAPAEPSGESPKAAPVQSEPLNDTGDKPAETPKTTETPADTPPANSDSPAVTPEPAAAPEPAAPSSANPETPSLSGFDFTTPQQGSKAAASAP